MKYRFAIAIAIAALLAVPAVAGAAPATVQLRVEGLTETIFEGPVTTDGKTIDKGGTAAPCGNDDPDNPVPTMTTALEDSGLDWDADYYGDFYVSRVGPDASDFVNNRYWGIALNQVPTSVGGCQQQVTDGDEVLFAYDFFRPDYSNKALLKLEGPQIAEVGKPATVSVSEIECTDYTCAATTSAPAVGATVGGGQTVAADGTAQLSLDAGTAHLKAEKAGAIRSNALDVCVHVAGDGNCENLPPKPGTKVKDSSVPVASIAGITDGAKLRRGPKILKGKVADAGSSGLKFVKLSLRRHKGGHCSWWSASAERFSGGSCERKVFFAIGNKADWSYQLAKMLGPGHYVLDVKAVDNAGNRGDSFVRGRSRIVFDVTGDTRSARASKSKKSAAKAQLMVVGKSGSVLSDARTVKAKAITVRASGRRCLVGASTPLAALAAGRGKLALSLKDFGSCSRDNARDAAQLFVRSIGGETNKGADGWVYKLRDKIPPVGAGDRTAKVKNGDEVVWFYCVHDSAGHCQPTLRIVAPKAALPNEPIPIRVLKVDDEGRTSPAAGAGVAYGTQSLVTGADGRVGVAGLGAVARVSATLAGAIPSFPLTIAAATSGPIF